MFFSLSFRNILGKSKKEFHEHFFEIQCKRLKIIYQQCFKHFVYQSQYWQRIWPFLSYENKNNKSRFKWQFCSSCIVSVCVFDDSPSFTADTKHWQCPHLSMCPLHSSTTTKTKLLIHEKQNLSFNHNPPLKSIKTDNMGCL